MRLPQPRCLRIKRRDRAVGERLQRAVSEPARLFDPPTSGHAIGQNDPAGHGRQCDNESRTETKQQSGVDHTWQKRQEIKQGKDKEAAEHGERRPAGGPDPLP
jgi:hypothetical protein